MRFLFFFISSGFLIGLVLLARTKFRNKLAPGVIYAMWLIPLLRLLIPFGVWEAPVFGTAAQIINAPYDLVSEWLNGENDNASEMYTETGNEDTQTSSREMAAVTSGYDTAKTEAEVKRDAPTESNEAASGKIMTENFPIINIEVVLYGIWIVGSLEFGCYVLWKNRQLKKGISSMKRTVSTDGLTILVSDRINVPCLVGVIQPQILIPQTVFQDPELYECALSHERAHYQQKDHIWTAVRIFMCIVYWWNPFVWIGAKYVEEDAELACDARVLKGQTPEGRRKYGYALLQILANAQGDNYRMCIATSMDGSKKSMKKRIEEIANGTVTKKGVLLPFLAIMVMVLVVGCAVPTQKSWLKTADRETGETEDATFSEAEYRYALQDDINSMLLYSEVYEYGELLERRVLSYGNTDEKNGSMKFRSESAFFEDKQTLIIEANGIGTEMEAPAAKYSAKENGNRTGGTLQSEKGKIEVAPGTDLILLSDYRAEGEEGITLYNCEQLSLCTEEELKELLKDNYIVSFVRVIFSDKKPEDLHQSFTQREYPTEEEITAERNLTTAWAEAFSDRDAAALVSMATAETCQLMIENGLMEENYQSFGFSSPWPMFTDPRYQIVSCDESGAEILYYATDSTPHIAVWKEELGFSQDNGELLVSYWQLEWYDSIGNVEDFYVAYPGGEIAGTVMDYYTNGLGEALNKNAKENPNSSVYQALFDAEQAAAVLLNISTGEDFVSYSVEDTGGEATVQIHFLKDGGMEDVLEVVMWQPYGEDGIWLPKAVTGIDTAPVETDTLSMDMFLDAVRSRTVEATDWQAYSNGIKDNLSSIALNYYVSYPLNYEGQDLRLDFSYEKENNLLSKIYLLKEKDDSMIWIYSEEDGLRFSAEDILSFIRTDKSILNEISFELPQELSVGDYNANVGFEGGCLILPMVYEGDEESTPDEWMASGMVSRYTQSSHLEWKNGEIDHVYSFYNHTSMEILEKVEGLCAPALLVQCNHDLYTAAGMGELEEEGVDLTTIETTSDYWYLYIAEPGEEYGYVITLNQKNYTKEDILNVGKTIQIKD